MNGQNDAQLTPNEHNTTESVVATLPDPSGGVPLTVHTPSGAAWLQKYLHPPCATDANYAGIPDKNASPSAFAEYKVIENIPTFRVVAGVTRYFDKVLVIHTSSVKYPLIAYRANVTNPNAYDPTDAIYIQNRYLDVSNMVGQNASGRLAYKSTTISLNATAFNNQGVVTCAQFRPNMMVATYTFATVTKMLAKYENRCELLKQLWDDHHSHMKKPPQLFTTKFASRIVKHVRDEDSDYEVIQEKRDRDDGYEEAAVKAAALANSIQFFNAGVIPIRGTDVAMMSPNSTSTVASEGSFVVQKYDADSIPYKGFGDDDVDITVSGTVEGIRCYTMSLITPTTLGLSPWIDQVAPTVTLRDLPWFDMTWGYTLYEGLSVTTTASPTVTPPYLTVKGIMGFEFQPLPNSPLAPFIKNAAIYDAKAIEFASVHMSGAQDSLPAAANFWGSLGKILLNNAPKIIKTVKSIFGNKEIVDRKKSRAPQKKAVTQQPRQAPKPKNAKRVKPTVNRDRTVAIRTESDIMSNMMRQFANMNAQKPKGNKARKPRRKN